MDRESGAKSSRRMLEGTGLPSSICSPLHVFDKKCFMSRKLAKPVVSAFRKQRQGDGEHQASLGSTVRSVSRTKKEKGKKSGVRRGEPISPEHINEYSIVFLS